MNLTIVKNKLALMSDVKKALLLSFVLGASSILSFKVPFMPVPWIVQNQLCIIIGLVFGARVGFMSALFFLIEGACGAPFFSFGRSGLGMIVGPSGGYLLAYPFAALVAGVLRNILPCKNAFTFLNLTLSNLVIYLVGVTQLSLFVGFSKAMTLGFFPFIALDIVKSVIATFFVGTRKVK